MMNETFPLPLRTLLGYILSEETKFFQNLHSRRDSRFQYQLWQSDPRMNCFNRLVTFNTNQAPITVGVNQKQKLYRAGRYVESGDSNILIPIVLSVWTWKIHSKASLEVTK